MQQSSCRSIAVLLSKYADNEASPSERAKVEGHLATCADCRRKLAGYAELQVIFHTEPPREPEPELRAGLFAEIRTQQEAERRAGARRVRNPWYWPFPSHAHPPAAARSDTRASGVWAFANPLVLAGAALLAVIGVAALLRPAPAPVEPNDVARPNLPPVPTVLAAISRDEVAGGAGAAIGPSNPGAVPTRQGELAVPVSPAAFSSATVLPTVATAANDAIQLSRPAPVLEAGDPLRTATWHTLQDPAGGYTLSYPPNWWTYVAGRTRFFYPWTAGGEQDAPYWMELRLEPNPEHLTPQTANTLRFDGQGTIISATGGGDAWLRVRSSDDANNYDELYSFDRDNIYTLRLSVPRGGRPTSFADRWAAAEPLLSKMSGSVSLPSQPATGGYAPVLFLNGSDLWSLDPVSGQTLAITHGGYAVRNFVLGPDMRLAAFTSARESGDLWPGSLQLAAFDDSGISVRAVQWPDLREIHDIAWYDNHTLLAIAATGQGGLGIYRLTIPRLQGDESEITPSGLVLVTQLQAGMVGARGLAVSPDRQMISFLAPMGESAGTDIYGVRPDGSGLVTLVSHSAPVAPDGPDGRVFTPDGQAVKSYLWVDGRLERGGYSYRILFTCGNAASPTFYRGGFLYETPLLAPGALLDQDRLGMAAGDSTKMQVVHMAVSTAGKLAITGYFNDRPGRADELAGLWVADLSGGALSGVRGLASATLNANRGITDLQWAPDGHSLIYRETVPQDPESLSARYDGRSPFSMIRLDTLTGEKTVLYTGR